MYTTSATDCRIYERFLEAAPPVTLASPWAELSLDTGARHCPPLTATIDRLRQDFSDAELLMSGVVRSGPAGSLLPAIPLSAADCVLLPLWRQSDEAPYEILTDSGCLSGSSLPAFAILEDFKFRSALGNLDMLLLAASLRDVVVLRALGLPTSLATNFDCLTLEQVKRCCHEFHWPPLDLPDPQVTSEGAAAVPVNSGGAPPIENGASAPAPEIHKTQPTAEKLRNITFVGWNVHDLDGAEPPAISRIRAYFEQLSSTLELDFAMLDNWVPTPAQINNIKVAISLRALPLVRKQVRASAQCDGRPFICYEAGDDASADPPISYTAATEGYHRARRQSGSRSAKGDLREALVKLEEATERDLIRPLIERAMADDDPLARSVGLLFASLSREQHRRLRIIDHFTAGPPLGAVDVDPTAVTQLKALLSLTDRTLAIAKSLKKWPSD